MKKLYTVLLLLVLAAMLTVGVYSLVDRDATESALEKRRLASKPEFSWSALLDGSYVSQLETYYSDTFPGRETLLKLNRQLNQIYYFSGSGDDNLLVLDYRNDAANSGESIGPPTETPPETDNQPDDPPEENPPADDPPETSTPALPPAPEEYTAAGNVIITGDRAMDIPTATESIIETYAQALGNLHGALGEDVRVISLLTPNSGEFYSPVDFRTPAHDQRAMIELCYGAMDRDIVKVDAYSALAAHTDEYIYFRTDHHWTALGAYYAYTAFCQALSLEPVPLADFETGAYENFLGSLYGWTSNYPQSQALLENPDHVDYYLPVVENHTHYYSDATLSDGVLISAVYQGIQEDQSNKYLCFVGGDHPVTVIETTVDGPTCLVLKESYGNAFLPFLTSHYGKIIAVDPREFNQEGKPSLDLAAFAKEQGVDDLIVLNYPFMINSAAYVKWLNCLVGIEDGE